MKVKELIEQLSKLDQNAEILRYGYEGGFEKIKEIVSTTFIEDFHDQEENWCGPHITLKEFEFEKTYNEGIELKDFKKFKGVVLV